MDTFVYIGYKKCEWTYRRKESIRCISMAGIQDNRGLNVVTVTCEYSSPGNPQNRNSSWFSLSITKSLVKLFDEYGLKQRSGAQVVVLVKLQFLFPNCFMRVLAGKQYLFLVPDSKHRFLLLSSPQQSVSGSNEKKRSSSINCDVTQNPTGKLVTDLTRHRFQSCLSVTLQPSIDLITSLTCRPLLPDKSD